MFFICLTIQTLHFYTVNVYLPKDRVTQMHQGYGFVEFMTEQDAEYASKVIFMIHRLNRLLFRVSCLVMQYKFILTCFIDHDLVLGHEYGSTVW